MGDKIVEVPGIGNVSFPGAMPDDVISGIIRAQHMPSPNATGLANQALRETGITVSAPAAPQPPAEAGAVSRFATAAGATLPSAPETNLKQQLDNLKAAGPAAFKNFIANMAQRIGSGDVAGGLGEVAGYGAQAELLRRAGGAAKESVAPPQPAAETASVLPETGHAGKMFQQVQAAVGERPINLTEVGDAAFRADALAKAGGSMPKVIRDFLRRTTDPKQPPITYAEARDFYSNATRLSADEMGRLTPVMRRQVGEFTQALGRSLQGTAETGGVGQQYASAMQEYRRASTLKSALAKGLKYAPAIGGGLYAAHEIGKFSK